MTGSLPLFLDEPEPGDRARTYREAMSTRIAAAGFFLLALAVLDQLEVFDVLIGPAALVVLVESALLLGTQRWASRSAGRAYAMLVVDGFFQTLVLWFLGPARVIVVLMVYIFSLIQSGIRLTRFGYFVAANAAVLFFALLVTLENRGILPSFSANNVLFDPAQRAALVVIVLLSMNAAAWYLASFDAIANQRAHALAVAQRALERHSRSLEATVAARTAEIREANDLLAEKNRQLELYARAVSHDLRSPMVAAGEALRVAADSDPAHRDRYLALARKNLDRADSMLLGLRDLMRKVGSRAPAAPVDLHALLDEVLAETRAAHPDRPLVVQVQGDLGMVRAQPAKIAHVLRNLVANAIEHGARTNDLRIEVGRRDTGPEPCFYVRDNGEGIPYDHQARIFEPFRRGPRSGTGRMGLGLALVAQIVAEHGGRTWVESTPGEGASFYFTLPQDPG